MRTTMTARAAAACPRGCRAAVVLPARSRLAGLGSAGTAAAACGQRAPGLPGPRRVVIALALPSQSARLTVSLVSVFPTLSTTNYYEINIQSMCSAYLSRIAAWHVDKFVFPFHAQGVCHDLPGRSPVMGAARRRDPQHFHRVRTGSGPLCTRHPHVCAQKACCCAMASKICGRPIRPCRHCSRDDAAPSLAGEHTDGLAPARGRVRCRAYRLRVAAQPSGDIAFSRWLPE